MKKVLVAGYALCMLLGVAGTASAQSKTTTPNQDVDAAGLPEDVLRTDANKNLKAAQLYYTRKAYIGALERCEETIAVYQRFKKFDEFLYIAGMSSLRLSRKEGKQPPKLAPEQYLVLARQYLSQLVEQFPKSSFRKRAEAELQSIGTAAANSKAEVKP